MVNLTNLFKTIEEKGLTKSQVAKDTGISSGNISDWQSGRSMPTAIKLDTLANYLDVSVDYLLGRTDEPQTVSNSGTSIRQQYIGDYGSATITNGSKNEDDKDNNEILEMIKKLSVVQKAEIILKINEMINKNI